jgi:hypothetical protein
MSAVGDTTDSAVITSSAVAVKAMTAPTVAIAPAGPRADADKDTVVEIA